VAIKEAFEIVEFTVGGILAPHAEPASRVVKPQFEHRKDVVRACTATNGRIHLPCRQSCGEASASASGRPTDEGVVDWLDYGHIDMQEISVVVDFIAGGERTRVSRSPASVPDRSAATGLNGWVFRKVRSRVGVRAQSRRRFRELGSPETIVLRRSDTLTASECRVPRSSHDQAHRVGQRGPS
jgi:hypothetical protein